MNNLASTESWEDVLSKCIADLRQKHPNYSDAQIADSLEIPRTTFTRIKNDKKIPQLHNLLKILIGSGNKHLLLDAMKLFDDNLATAIHQTLEVALKEDNKRFVEKQFEALLDDRDVFVAYLLAALDKGTTDQQLTEVLGAKGIEAITTLIKKGYVKQHGDTYKTAQDQVLVRSFDSIKHHLVTYAKFYNPAHVGQQRNYVHSMSRGLNKTGLRKLAEAHKRFHEEVQRIYKEQNYVGDIPAFSVAFCDTFTNDEIPHQEVH